MKLQEVFGREPTDEELAEEMGMTASRVAQMRTAAIRPASLDAPIGDDDSNNFAEVVQDENAHSPYEKLEATFNGDILEGVFQTLCVIPTKWSEHRSFCNSLLIYHYREATPFYPKTMYVPSLGDGSPFPVEMLEEISAYAERRTGKVYWEKDQILIFDNSRYMHGRTGFTDTERRILVRMGHVKRGES